MSNKWQAGSFRFYSDCLYDISRRGRPTDCVSEKKAVPLYSLTMYNHLVVFDGCVADGNTLEAVCQWEMSEHGFSLHAIQTDILDQSFNFDKSTMASNFISSVITKPL